MYEVILIIANDSYNVYAYFCKLYVNLIKWIQKSGTHVGAALV